MLTKIEIGLDTKLNVLHSVRCYKVVFLNVTNISKCQLDFWFVSVVRGFQEILCYHVNSSFLSSFFLNLARKNGLRGNFNVRMQISQLETIMSYLLS